MKVWDYLLWNYFCYKILLFRNNKKKKLEMYNLVNEFLKNINDKNYKNCFKKFWKENDFMSINTKKQLIQFMQSLRKCLLKNVSGLVFPFSETLQEIQKQAKERKITYKNPSLWGKNTWLLLHVICLDKKCKKKKLLLTMILNSLPCDICRKHALEYVSTNPIRANHDYFFDFHNFVNHRLKKPKSSCPKKAIEKIKSNCKKLLVS